MKNVIRAFVIVSIAIVSCKKNNDSPFDKGRCKYNGKFEMAGCGWGVWQQWWIRLDDGTLVQPCKSQIALDAAQIKKGMAVKVGFTKLDPADVSCLSPIDCFVAPPEHISVEITCLTMN